MANVLKGISLNGYNAMFGDTADTDNSGITEIDIEKLCEFANQPFKVLMDDSMTELAESIKEQGVLTPITVRPIDGGKYEILSGHRRVKACRMVSIKTVPAIVKELDDEDARILLVDSNLQREVILPSEKAYAYKMKLDAMKHKAGRKSLDNSDTKANNARAELAEQTGESSSQIQRYLRLTKLYQGLLDYVDEGKISINGAAELSYLTEDEQYYLLELIEEESVKCPNNKQCIELHTISKEWAKHVEEQKKKGVELEAVPTAQILNILKSSSKPKSITIKATQIKKYFPAEYSTEEIEGIVTELLENWAKQHPIK